MSPYYLVKLYLNVREDSSTGSTHKLPAEVEL
ncbi:MAG: palindromic element RPE1 domain-containing protein [Rickettsia sp.]|nr:palindromic element RPE1 domain-containing protein [Rickettsia sp.]